MIQGYLEIIHMCKIGSKELPSKIEHFYVTETSNGNMAVQPGSVLKERFE